MAMRILDRLEEILISVLIAAATIIIFVAVIHRYSLTGSVNLTKWGRAHDMPAFAAIGRALFDFLRAINLTWAQEVCIFMFVWMAKFGAAYGVRTGIHVGVDVLVIRLSPKSRFWTILFCLFCGAFFTFIVGALGARFVWHMALTDQTSPDLELPMWLVYLAVPVGSWLMCFRFLQVAYRFLRTGDVPEHDHAHVEGVNADGVEEHYALAPVGDGAPLAKPFAKPLGAESVK